MSKISKIIQTIIVLVLEYLFVAVYYPNKQESIIFLEESAKSGFQSMQLLQFFYSYSWIIVIGLLALIWMNEIKSIVKK